MWRLDAVSPMHGPHGQLHTGGCDTAPEQPLHHTTSTIMKKLGPCIAAFSFMRCHSSYHDLPRPHVHVHHPFTPILLLLTIEGPTAHHNLVHTSIVRRIGLSPYWEGCSGGATYRVQQVCSVLVHTPSLPLWPSPCLQITSAEYH